MKLLRPGKAIAATLAGAFVSASAMAAVGCSSDAMGTARTLVLKREYGAWGKIQHDALPLRKGEVVLTFDDGPHPENTPLVLKVLADQCVKATFFMVGDNLTRFPELARQVVSEGHSAGMHSYTHPHLGTMSAADQLDDLKKTEDIFRSTFGIAAPAYRFPFLEETPVMMEALKAKNIAVFSIDMGIDDWQPNDTTDILTARIAERLKTIDAGIILMHDAHPGTDRTLPVVLKVLKDNGFSVVHLDWAN
jgi:peptidoglycan/xylan/chitin deacetylase (PgdA/CDA1 family)